MEIFIVITRVVTEEDHCKPVPWILFSEEAAATAIAAAKYAKTFLSGPWRVPIPSKLEECEPTNN